MKKNILFLFFLLLVAFSSAKAEIVQTTSHKLTWNAVEKWSNDSSTIQVISFVGAHYPSDNRLPSFNTRIAIDAAYSYSAVLLQPSYIPVTDAEKLLLGSLITNAEPIVTTKVLTSRKEKFLSILISPFVLREGQLLKLASFDLQISKRDKLAKVSSTVNHTYVQNSVLANGKFVKIRLINSGVYKLTFEDIKAMGVDPANVRVFGYGGGVLEQSFAEPKLDDLPELAIWMEKGADGIFNAGDYVLFYAQGITKWAYNEAKQMFTHQINPYSKYAYYFVSSDAGIGKRITEMPYDVPANATVLNVTEFDDFKVHENEKVNLTSSGKDFYGEVFREITSYNLGFNFPNPVSGNTVKTRLDVAASSMKTTYFSLNLNGLQTKSLAVSARSGDIYEQGKAANSTFFYSPSNENLTFTLSYAKSEASSTGYLNYLEVNARRRLVMAGSQMQFQNVDYLNMGLYSRYKLANFNSNVQVWNITEPTNISKITTTTVADTMSFIASSNVLTHYLAIDPTTASEYPKPEVVGVVANQNLHAISQAELVIITHPDFRSQADELAKAHREKDNMTVAVVTTEEVYNEFSSGTPDATAYRWVLKMLYDRAYNQNKPEEAPKHLLLFGRGSFDNRKILLNSGDNLVLTYQDENSLVTTLSYVTDDYFTLLDDDEGDYVPSGLMDVGVGRFPAKNAQEATDVVNKTIAYMNNGNKGGWKNQLCFIADDGDNATHMIQADKIADLITKNHPAYQVNKILLDAFNEEVTASGQRYPTAETKLQNLLRSGLMLLNYTGHAGPTGWASEAVLPIAAVKSLSNKNLPVWVGATCDFLQYDVQQVSAGEHVVLNPSGGGIGILSAARPVYSSPNFTLNKAFCERLFVKTNGKESRVGDILMEAKNNVGTEINKLSYVYMGDPAIRLNYPSKYKVVTSQINENTSFGTDTLRALSVATVKGYIADENNIKINSFNGTVRAIVFDKIQRVTSLNNEHDGTITFDDRSNTLFSGDAKVENGEFSFSFMLPKDIKYNYGSGRINYYAQDDVNDAEAQGYFENFTVGGTDNNYTYETDGPQAQIYLNSENFVSGDKVNEMPMFIANLSDVNGINTVGSGIGHDISMIVDKDPTKSFVLNDYFQAAINSYTDGQINFKLPLMAEGKHTLTFRVWDLLNNSTTKSLDFEVLKGLKPVIFRVYNFPNPVKSQTNFVIEHDRPETILKTTVDIFDLSGRKVWSFSQPTAENIHWDLVTSDGMKLKTGVYLYRININTTDSDICSKTNKLLIVEQ